MKEELIASSNLSKFEPISVDNFRLILNSVFHDLIQNKYFDIHSMYIYHEVMFFWLMKK